MVLFGRQEGHPVLKTSYRCAGGCVVECRICNREVAGSNLSLGYFAPRSTQPWVGKWVPAAAWKAKAGMAHSDCGWTCGFAGKTVKSLEKTCHTWALLRWWFTTKRRYIKCMHLYLYTVIPKGSSVADLRRPGQNVTKKLLKQKLKVVVHGAGGRSRRSARSCGGVWFIAVFENTYFMFFFSDFKKTWLLRFLEMTYQKVVKSL